MTGETVRHVRAVTKRSDPTLEKGRK